MYNVDKIKSFVRSLCFGINIYHIVQLASTDKMGNRRMFNQAYKYKSSKYIDTKDLITVGLTFGYYLLIETSDRNKNKQTMYIGINNYHRTLSKMKKILHYFESHDDIYLIDEDDNPVVNSERKETFIIGNKDKEWIFQPSVYRSAKDDTVHECIAIDINEDRYTMYFDELYELVYFLDKFDLYNSSLNLINTLKITPEKVTIMNNINKDSKPVIESDVSVSKKWSNKSRLIGDTPSSSKKNKNDGVFFLYKYKRRSDEMSSKVTCDDITNVIQQMTTIDFSLEMVINIDGVVYNVVEKAEKKGEAQYIYCSNTGSYVVLPFNEDITTDDSESVGVNGDIVIFPSDDTKYSAMNINILSPEKILQGFRSTRKEELPGTVDSITVLPIDYDKDDMLKIFLKMMINEKKTNLSLYKDRFPRGGFSNKTKPLYKNDGLSFKVFKEWCEVLDIDFKIVATDSKDAQYPLGETKVIENKDY